MTWEYMTEVNSRVYAVKVYTNMMGQESPGIYKEYYRDILECRQKELDSYIENTRNVNRTASED